ncbi:ParA family protein, partial [Klebsiella quasipneumoniae]|uniref:ParA family protein n=1 Tax=Klebsiella quasipneumoniae TaxID=1463165 RepID=UPI0020051351
GVGKSTFNIMVASCFHFLARQEVVLIDCDQPQSNVYKLRQQEIEELKNDEEKRADFQAQERPSYGVYNASLPEALELMKQLDGKVDMVFIDMPGTLNNPSLPPIWAMLDYIFMPMHGDPFSVTATEGFVKIIREFIQKIPGNRLKGYYAFWNQH